MVDLSTELNEPGNVPYFRWDDPMTVEELRARLSSASRSERIRLVAKILRQARDTDVWLFLDIEELLEIWKDVRPLLGRRRGFWEYLIAGWKRDGLIG